MRAVGYLCGGLSIVALVAAFLTTDGIPLVLCTTGAQTWPLPGLLCCSMLLANLVLVVAVVIAIFRDDVSVDWFRTAAYMALLPFGLFLLLGKGQPAGTNGWDISIVCWVSAFVLGVLSGHVFDEYGWNWRTRL